MTPIEVIRLGGSDLGKHEIFVPTKTYPVMTVGEIAQ